MILAVKYVNLYMSYKLNPVFPRSIYQASALFIDMMGYYMQHELPKISHTMLVIFILYFVAFISAVVGSIKIHSR